MQTYKQYMSLSYAVICSIFLIWLNETWWIVKWEAVLLHYPESSKYPNIKEQNISAEQYIPTMQTPLHTNTSAVGSSNDLYIRYFDNHFRFFFFKQFPQDKIWKQLKTKQKQNLTAWNAVSQPAVDPPEQLLVDWPKYKCKELNEVNDQSWHYKYVADQQVANELRLQKANDVHDLLRKQEGTFRHKIQKTTCKIK